METNVRSNLIKWGLIEAHTLPTSSGEFRITCPECKNDKQKCYVNAQGKGVTCFHCRSWSWIGFSRLYEPPTPQEVALESFVTKAQENLKNAPEVLKYLEQRGLEQQTLHEARIGYVPSDWTEEPSEIDVSVGLSSSYGWALAGRVILPYLRDTYVLSVRGRSLDDQEPKYKSLAGHKVQPYCTSDLDFSKPLFLCEGEIDALILSQSGLQSIGMPGVNTLNEYGDLFQKFSKVYSCFDGDKAGRGATEKIKKMLSEVYVVALPEGYDVNEYISTFGQESFHVLVEGSYYFVDGKLQTNDSLKSTIESWVDWSWTNGELLGPRISWAPRLEKALSGWSKGLFLLGSLPNSGKSCIMVKSAYEACKDNPDDTLVVYLSLDDDIEDAVCRLVSLHTGISFEEIRTPKISFDHPTDKSKRNPERLKYVQDKLEELKKIDNLIVRDSRFGRSLQYIRTYTATLRKRHPDKKIVMFIDSLAKVTAEGEPDSFGTYNWKAHLANELKYLTNLYNLCVVTPADLRKLNDGRRPTNDDLKDAAELAYESNAVLLGFNEVNLKGVDDAILKWRDENTGREWPILELNLSKNKKSMFRGAIRFKFFPATSDFRELSEQEDQDLNQKVKEHEQRFKKSGTTNPGIFTSSYKPDFSTDITKFA